MKRLGLGIAAVLFAASTAAAQAPNGATVYKDRCAQCHDKAQDRTPDLTALRSRTAEQAFAALTTGAMAVHGQKLSPEETRAVAEFVSGKSLAAGSPASSVPAASCGAAPNAPINPSAGSRWNGWGYDLTNSRFQPQPGLAAADVPKLTLKWAFGFPGGSQAYAQPTIVSGRLFTGSDNGTVYALAASSGCTYWTFKADRGVRTAIVIGPAASGRMAAFFGDVAANVYAVDAETGSLIWRQKADDHRFARITGAPTFHDGRLYVPVSSVEEASAAQPSYPCCSFRGSVIAYEAATGKQIWKTYTIPEAPKEVGKTSAGTPILKPAGAAVWNSPTIDVARGALYVGTGNAYTEPAADTSDAVVAMDLKTGKILWVNQATPSDAFVMNCRQGVENCPNEIGPDYDFGNSPILRNLPGGRRILVIGQKSGVAYGLDPDANGKKLWEYRAGKGTALGGMEWGSAADDQNVYLPVSDVLLPAAQSGGLHAVNLATGQRVWHTPAPPLGCTTGRGCTGAQSAPVSVIPGVVFSGSMDGHMRAYSTADGKVIWEFNTARDFQTVNGVAAKGGSIDAAGPAIAEGMLFTPSGYALFRGNPGNVLLAFTVK